MVTLTAFFVFVLCAHSFNVRLCVCNFSFFPLYCLLLTCAWAHVFFYFFFFFNVCVLLFRLIIFFSLLKNSYVCVCGLEKQKIILGINVNKIVCVCATRKSVGNGHRLQWSSEAMCQNNCLRALIFQASRDISTRTKNYLLFFFLFFSSLLSLVASKDREQAFCVLSFLYLSSLFFFLSSGITDTRLVGPAKRERERARVIKEPRETSLSPLIYLRKETFVNIEFEEDQMNKVFISRTDGSIPWGFRLQGGLEDNEPLTVSNVSMYLFSETIDHVDMKSSITRRQENNEDKNRDKLLTCVRFGRNQIQRLLFDWIEWKNDLGLTLIKNKHQ